MFIPLVLLVPVVLAVVAGAGFVTGLYVGKRNPKVLAQLPTSVPGTK